MPSSAGPASRSMARIASGLTLTTITPAVAIRMATTLSGVSTSPSSAKPTIAVSTGSVLM